MPISTKTERKGYWIFKQGKVKKDLETDKRIHFIIEFEEKDHYVIFDKLKNKFSCDCEFFSLHQETCSHIIASKYFLEDEVKDK